MLDKAQEEQLQREFAEYRVINSDSVEKYLERCPNARSIIYLFYRAYEISGNTVLYFDTERIIKQLGIIRTTLHGILTRLEDYKLIKRRKATKVGQHTKVHMKVDDYVKKIFNFVKEKEQTT